MVMVANQARALMIEHATRDYPEECCGVLLGGLDPLAAHEALAAHNAHPAERRVGYTIDPHDMVRADARAAELGLEIMGFYHSHPDQPAAPSAEDRRHAWPGYLYVIVAIDARGRSELRAWRFEAAQLQPRELALDWNGATDEL
jgi:proteasome lid subunit RPN8/RPN11